MMSSSGWFEHWRTARALGMGNVARVAAYRGMKRAGIARWLTSRPDGLPKGSLFRSGSATSAELDPDLAVYFSKHRKPVNGHVPWLYDPFADEPFEAPERHWSEIPDFVRPGRDIKAIWELSRFDWALKLALAAIDRKSDAPIGQLNALIGDWQTHNPPYLGPNWKCGQETTIRMLQTLLAALLLDEDEQPTDDLRIFVDVHCRRVAATLMYALAQDNNHSISEAVGLFIGGSWLVRHGAGGTSAKAWQDRGRRCLERLVDRLFADDGSFSQYSITYHRFVIDMIAQAEFWRRRLGLPRFSDRFHAKVSAGIDWLFDLTDPVNGDGPNVGSNDGARLFVLTDTDYRDFRPSIQFAAKLFWDSVPYPEGAHDQQLVRLGLSPEPRQVRQRRSKVMADGGFVLMLAPAAATPGSWTVIRFPNFKFRPPHADALHVDLWVDGLNLLRDSGSFSYNPAPGDAPDLRATSAHNTIEFDGRDQMPRLGRFLYGDWLKPSEVGDLIETDAGLSWTGSYQDNRGCRHRRTVICEGSVWRIIDRFSGQRQKAILRWRLAPGDWRLDGAALIGNLANVVISADRPPRRIDLVEGKESRYYLDLQTIPVLEVEVDEQTTSIETRIELEGSPT